MHLVLYFIYFITINFTKKKGDSSSYFVFWENSLTFMTFFLPIDIVLEIMVYVKGIYTNNID